MSKQRIKPKGPPSNSGAPKLRTKFAPLAEFGPHHEFVLHPAKIKDAPKTENFTCVAAWDIQQSQETLDRFQVVSDKIGNVQLLYHGTRAHNITDIAAEGLRPGGAYCMFGSGIYLGSVDKAINYTGYNDGRYIIAVQAALGGVYEAPGAGQYDRKWLKAKHCHSVMGVAGKTASWDNRFLAHSEYVVYSPEQALAVKVFEYQARFAQPLYPKEGTCAVVVESAKPLPKGSSAFRDLLGREPCGQKAYTEIRTKEHRSFWACSECIQRLKLKQGSAVEILRDGMTKNPTLVRVWF